GRVSFLPLAPSVHGNGLARSNRLIELSHLSRVRMPLSADGIPAHPGVVAVAGQLVTCTSPELADLPELLLGHTLIVKDLEAARAIASHTIGYRFLTLHGELLEPDGTLTLGTHYAESGILSRKSELRELREQVGELDQRIAGSEQELINLRER